MYSLSVYICMCVQCFFFCLFFYMQLIFLALPLSQDVVAKQTFSLSDALVLHCLLVVMTLASVSRIPWRNIENAVHKDSKCLECFPDWLSQWHTKCDQIFISHTDDKRHVDWNSDATPSHEGHCAHWVFSASSTMGFCHFYSLFLKFEPNGHHVS